MARSWARCWKPTPATFTVITSVPAELAQRGSEPPLSTIARSLLFSIAHNALTNVIRHAEASRVVIGLDCTGEELRLLNLQRQLARLKLLIIDELGFVPLSHIGAELLFEVFGQRYERGSILVTTNLPFDEWPEVFGSERLTGALLDRLTHHVHILEMNGDSYRLRGNRREAAAGTKSPGRSAAG